jgi:hypothetical protein
MSKFERVLAEGSTELPDCRCSVEMHLISVVPGPDGGSETRIFRCPDCNHELRLTIWHNGCLPGRTEPGQTARRRLQRTTAGTGVSSISK